MAKKELKEYGISTLKGAIGAIPIAGTFLNEIAFEARSRIKQDRIFLFIEDLSTYLLSFEKGKFNFEDLDTEKIGDIFEEIVISVSKTSANHKREIFKKILTKQLNGKKNGNDEIFRHINITNEISEIQFNILSNFNSFSDKMGVVARTIQFKSLNYMILYKIKNIYLIVFGQKTIVLNKIIIHNMLLIKYKY